MNGTPDRDASPEDRILAMARAFQASRVLLTAHELDVFTLLSRGAKSAGDVARQAATDERAMDRLLGALCALGFLEKKNGLFANTPESERFLSRDSEEYLAGLAHMSQQFRSWASLTQAVRQGTKADPGPIDSDDGQRTRDFIAAMHGRAKGNAANLARLIGLDGVRRILDVGGGSGVYAMALVREAREATAVVLDLPKVALLARQYLREAGMQEKIAVVPGDYHQADFGSGFDLIVFSAVLHINSAQENLALAHKAFAALNPAGRVAIEDFVMDEDRTGPARGALFALNMLVSTTRGDTYTEAEIFGWLRRAGFTDLVRKQTGPGSSLIVGRKPS
ncbi:MAG: methyltransferase domain-containing protein [Desulfovibrionaceae bacterium]|nr:methyltransferase domain-containing protein [Desulfovibrionaceae bacterium]MBF0514094.1 methyltransferase domain-containing protein [Desulfovibrionaceae bacterium]